ncbi:telomerase reverse transcriptase isoform X3 [Amborella trichopoda]|uniref:telomerase reverse transcriptase isoform X3 n=1 Tax=Amborella trichopoda TaxID=13333 RepID=UPI0009BD2FEF|nr:telomerase reverse transcriptase isoform X3 [Amborella trichopoda]|eukprot:XP_020528940.1 telomerase reverse transcriptase isoform X3 [Amborella trichopoda]
MATSISLKPELATMKRKKRKRRVPEFMRRVYGDKYVNTLGNVILSMLPLQNGGTLGAHTGCRCKGRGCLGCSGDPMAFILRDGDPPDYRALISRSFAVLHLLPDLSLPFSPHVRWTQEQIVRRVIDMESCIPYRFSSSPNVMCVKYEKRGHHKWKERQWNNHKSERKSQNLVGIALRMTSYANARILDVLTTPSSTCMVFVCNKRVCSGSALAP